MSQTALTYRDYEALPDDGRRYEIHNGELSVTPAPSFDHQLSLMNLLRGLFQHVPAVAPGLIMAALLSDRPDETSIVQPDILYIAPDRMARTSRRGMEGGPTLAVTAVMSLPGAPRAPRLCRGALKAA
jgi:putative restriction endonuclease